MLLAAWLCGASRKRWRGCCEARGRWAWGSAGRARPWCARCRLWRRRSSRMKKRALSLCRTTSRTSTTRSRSSRSETSSCSGCRRWRGWPSTCAKGPTTLLSSTACSTRWSRASGCTWGRHWLRHFPRSCWPTTWRNGRGGGPRSRRARVRCATSFAGWARSRRTERRKARRTILSASSCSRRRTAQGWNARQGRVRRSPQRARLRWRASSSAPGLGRKRQARRALLGRMCISSLRREITAAYMRGT